VFRSVVVATIPPAALRPPTMRTVTGCEGDREAGGIPAADLGDGSGHDVEDGRVLSAPMRGSEAAQDTS
jgi:hypothetical protein